MFSQFYENVQARVFEHIFLTFFLPRLFNIPSSPTQLRLYVFLILFDFNWSKRDVNYVTFGKLAKNTLEETQYRLGSFRVPREQLSDLRILHLYQISFCLTIRFVKQRL